MKNYTSVLLIAAILLVVNLLSKQFFLRADLTEDKQYTLGRATNDILENLEEPVTITAYFTEGLPTQYASIKDEFRDLLIEYNNRSKGKVAYEFKDPNSDQQLEQEIQQKGVQPVMIQIREKDQMVNQRAYLAASVKVGEQEDIIPFIQPGGAMEYALTTGIKKMAVSNKPAVGFVSGHGEPGLDQFPQAYQAMAILYTPEPVTLDAEIPMKFGTVAMIAPSDSIPPRHFATLDQFLGRGGKLFLGVNAVDGDFSTAQGTAKTTGLETWLRQKGVQIEPSFIVDNNAGQISVRQGNFPFPMQVKFPYFPNIGKFSDHPITKGLEAVMLQFASPITFAGDTSAKFTPIAYSSARSGTINTPMQFDVQKRWAGPDFPMSNLVVAGVLEGNLVGNVPSKIVIVSDGDFAVNGPRGQQQQQKPKDNISLLVNGVDWLSDDTGLIDLRTRGATSRPLDEIPDGKKATLKYLNLLLPIGFVLLYGFFRFNRRRSQRMKRMQQTF